MLNAFPEHWLTMKQYFYPLHFSHQKDLGIVSSNIWGTKYYTQHYHGFLSETKPDIRYKPDKIQNWMRRFRLVGLKQKSVTVGYTKKIYYQICTGKNTIKSSALKNKAQKTLQQKALKGSSIMQDSSKTHF